MAKKSKVNASKKGPKGPKAPEKRKTRADVPGASGVRAAASDPDMPHPKGHNGKPDLNADQMRSLFISHRTSWNGWMAKQAVVDKIGIDVKAALKADGFTVKQMQIADDLATVKGEAKITGEVEDRLKVARWIGHPMGAQLDLFNEPDRTPSVDRAFDNGKQSSMENKPRKAPHSPETEQARSWYAGYDSHQGTLQGKVGRGPEPKQESAPAAPDAPTAGHAVSRSEFNRRLQEQTKADPATGAPLSAAEADAAVKH